MWGVGASGKIPTPPFPRRPSPFPRGLSAVWSGRTRQPSRRILDAKARTIRGYPATQNQPLAATPERKRTSNGFRADFEERPRVPTCSPPPPRRLRNVADSAHKTPIFAFTHNMMRITGQPGRRRKAKGKNDKRPGAWLTGVSRLGKKKNRTGRAEEQDEERVRPDDRAMTPNLDAFDVPGNRNTSDQTNKHRAAQPGRRVRTEGNGLRTDPDRRVGSDHRPMTQTECNQGSAWS